MTRCINLRVLGFEFLRGTENGCITNGIRQSDRASTLIFVCVLVFTIRKYNLLKSVLTNGEDETVAEKHSASFVHKKPGSYKLQSNLQVSAITGLHGEDAEKFSDYQLENVRMIPVMHCWTPTGDILVGCIDGELLKVNFSDVLQRS